MDSTFEPDLLAEFLIADPGECRTASELGQDERHYRNLILDSVKLNGQVAVHTTVTASVAARGGQLVCLLHIIPSAQMDIAYASLPQRKDAFRRAQLEERAVWESALKHLELQHVGMRVHAASQATSPFRRTEAGPAILPSQILQLREKRRFTQARLRELSGERIRVRDLSGFDGYQWLDPVAIVGTAQRTKHGAQISLLAGSDAALEGVKAVQIHFTDVSPEHQRLVNEACRTKSRIRMRASIGISEIANRGIVARPVTLS